MRYGIGITTRNRPEVLKTAISQHLRFMPLDSKLVVIDDNSDTELPVEDLQTNSNCKYFRSNRRVGISGAKNECLLQLSDCDHVFLFDDDAWPRTERWADLWTGHAEKEDVGHSMYMADISTSPKYDPSIFIPKKVESSLCFFNAWDNCLGVALHFSRECLNKVGGYDSARAVNVYGYEHAQISNRARKAGFTRDNQHLSPIDVTDLVYTVDISYGWYGELPDIEIPWASSFTSSTLPEEVSRHNLNSKLMDYPEIYIPLSSSF